MSFLMVLLFLLIALFVFAQFGRHLSARRSLTWWLTLVFLGIATIKPGLLLPLAQVLGIELVSNLVIGGMIMLLTIQLIDQSAASHKNNLRLRELICAQSSEKAIRILKKLDARVLIVVPCYNEQETLSHHTDRLKKLCDTHNDFTYLMVNDGSSDRTQAILNTTCPENHTTHSANIGVGGCLMTAFQTIDAMSCKYVVQCDADGQHPVESIPALVAYAEQRSLDLLVGSRFTKKSCETIDARADDESTTHARRIGGRVVRGVLSLFGPAAMIDDPTSGFRVYSRQAAMRLLNHMPEEYPEPETIAHARLQELKIDEVRVTMAKRQGGTSTLTPLKSAAYMIKVATALLGLRLRSLMFGT